MNTPVTEAVWRGSFHPDGDAGASRGLREALLAQRRGQVQDALRQCRVLAQAGAAQVSDRVLAMTERLTVSSALLLDDPVFAIWLRFFYRAWGRGERENAVRHAGCLSSVLDDVERRLTGDAEAYVPGTSIAVEGRQLHDYVRAATPPSYDFTKLSALDDESVPGHPLRLQADLLGYALRNIGAAWPGVLDQITEYVRIFGYLPNADFRSCSAARYSGIVYLGNMDESILDLEESIVHETGHQVLYGVDELSRITTRDAPLSADYVLPWSGSRRDLFGYVHAFYIYALLIKYYWRRARLDPHLTMECQQRAGVILAGSIAAVPVLLNAPNMTEQGKAIVEQIAADLQVLRRDVLSVLGVTPMFSGSPHV